MKEIAELTVKYGVTGVLCAVIIFGRMDSESRLKELNTRLTVVEMKLYDCYTRLGATNDIISNGANEQQLQINRIYAILPSNPVGKIKKDEKTYS